MANDGGRERDEDRAVHTIPLDTEDGQQVVIAQEAQGSQAIVGGGEFPDEHEPRRPEDAAREQARLDAVAPVPPEDEPA
jgi:hypothetical protein